MFQVLMFASAALYLIAGNQLWHRMVLRPIDARDLDGIRSEKDLMACIEERASVQAADRNPDLAFLIAKCNFIATWPVTVSGCWLHAKLADLFER